jgi:ABC-type Fe3+/spermidine/putrescine transport system ATPase subunit
MAFLTIDSIDKRYEGDLLLEDVSLEVQRGELVSLLGPSGSGKTTLLRIIAGLESCEAGRVFLDGRDITEVPAHRRGVVLMFQEYALFPHRTVAENVAFGLRMASGSHASGHRPGRAEIARRVEEMLMLVGLEGFGARNVVDLSGGERQRVALARSLAPEPRLLLLDEPLGSLDRNLRERLLEELAVILRRVGVTAISVTHDQAEAFALADRVALLHETQIVQIDAPETILRYPATPWVAQFLGFDNLFPARLVSEHQVESALGRLVTGDRRGGDRPGVDGTLLVLPWGVSLDEAGGTAGAVKPVHGEAPRPAGGHVDLIVNSFTARVIRRVYQGRTTKLWLQIGEATLTLMLDMGHTIPEEGASVQGTIRPTALRWFASEPAQSVGPATSGPMQSQS